MSKQILVIGDEPDFIHKLKDTYSQFDVEVANASDSSIGLELLYNTHYDLIILLENFLKKPVYDISYQFNLVQHNTPIIIITDNITADKILFANELNIYDIYEKHGEFKELMLAIDKAINL